MNKLKRTALSSAVGAAFVGALAAAPLAQAAANPFSATPLASGYQLAQAGQTEGKCGGNKPAEGQGGGDMKAKEGKCGEGKCGGDMNKPKASEGKCGGDKKATEGKCGGNR